MATKPTCEFCQRQFSTAIILKTHMATAKYCLDNRPPKFKDELPSFVCDKCDKNFTRKGTLKDHIEICKLQLVVKEEKKIKKVTKKSAKKIIKLTEELDREKDTNCEIELLLEKANERIRELEIIVAHHEGKIDGLTTAKPPSITHNNYINQKLANLPIENVQPLTLEYVRSLADDYTYDYFIQGPSGIANFIGSFVTVYDEDDLEAPPKRNYACTDVPRHKYHKLGISGWKLDMGAKFLGEVFTEIKDKAKEHFTHLINLTTQAYTEGDMIQMQIYDDLKLNLIAPMISGINAKKGPKRDKLISDVRVHLRPFVSI